MQVELPRMLQQSAEIQSQVRKNTGFPRNYRENRYCDLLQITDADLTEGDGGVQIDSALGRAVGLTFDLKAGKGS